MTSRTWTIVGLLFCVLAALAFWRGVRLSQDAQRIAGHAAGLIDGARAYERAYRSATARN